MKNLTKSKQFETFFFLAALVLCFFASYGSAFAVGNTGTGLSGTTLMYALDKVNVRSGPGTDTDIIGELQPGETIFAVELTEEGWYRVVFEGEQGYIRQDFLEVYGTEGDWNGRDLSEYEALYDAGAEEDAEPAETESITEEEPDDTEAEEEPEKPKKNILPILIIIGVLTAIIIYSGVQIAQERRQSGKDDDEDKDGENPGDDSDAVKPEEYEILPEAEFEDEISEGNDYEKAVSEGDDFPMKEASAGDSEDELDIMELAWEIEEKNES